MKLSSAGLIFKHFGKEVVRNATKETWDLDLSDEQVDKVYQKMYKKLIFEVDAIDNGVSQTKEQLTYMIASGLASRVDRYNTAWNDPADVNIQDQFKKAMVIAEEEFIWCLRSIT